MTKLQPDNMKGPIAAATLTITDIPSKERFSREKEDNITDPFPAIQKIYKSIISHLVRGSPVDLKQ